MDEKQEGKGGEHRGQVKLVGLSQMNPEGQKQAMEFFAKMQKKYGATNVQAATRIGNLVGIIQAACHALAWQDKATHDKYHSAVEPVFADLCHSFIEAYKADGDKVREAVVEFQAFNELATMQDAENQGDQHHGASEANALATAALHKASRL